ncbi:neutral zinc metallopeptidase [Prauserella cavernicola]|uniref:Neutral zinc metallopeptidase n=1 Tax=Prauserella cavernicola TaxID=2800127 RepID=A0A934QXJ8_9PSEU|nr:neutral zinc metallopeptidase [Prauserella cavernicola]MBK1788343.1 neutral zinc metallopeptidase [Prauserella cavernicola]
MDRNLDVRPEKNNPFAILGVLVLVLGVVGVVALTGRALTPVRGIAQPAPDALARAASPEPPRPAEPTDSAEPEATGGLLGEGVVLAGVACELPGLGGSDEQLTAFYSAALTCLDTAWEPVLTSTGATFAEAGIEIASDAASSCGEVPGADEATAFYCGADSVIHMPKARIMDYLGLYEPAHLGVLAHEYGHHVQQLSGTLMSAGLRSGLSGPGSELDLEITRRIELQANCLAGLFLAAASGRGDISEDEARAAVADFANSIDSDTHGTLANQIRWAEIGFEGNGTAACDTWTVPAADVA